MSAMNAPRAWLRPVVGGGLWVLLLALGYRHLADPVRGGDRKALVGLWSFLSARPMTVKLVFPEDVEVSVGDPVFFRGGGGLLIPIGEVSELRRDGAVLKALHASPASGVREVSCLLRDLGPKGPSGGARARLLNVPQNESWVLRTLFPPERIAMIAREWNRTLLTHREEIFEVLAPIFRRLIRDLQEILTVDLPSVLARRRGPLAAIGQRFQADVVEKEFAPLLQTELWPVIERRAQPVLDAISAEVWERLPLWSLTWRLVYGSLPRASRTPLRTEINRFWREETVPIIREHAQDFLGLLRDFMQEATANDRVGAAFRRSFDQLLQDRELQHEMRLAFQEVILDNPRFHDRMAELWSSPELARALGFLVERLRPFVQRVSDEVLGTRAGGITPEFARVLRTQILQKDRRRIVIENPGEGSGPRRPLALGEAIPAIVEER